MIEAKGYAVLTAKEKLTPYKFQRRDPKEHDVVIDIQYCGICHSDIHQARDEWGGSMFPMVPGHEITGLVSAVGSKVTQFKVGDPVGVGCMVDSCQTCGPCQEHLEQYCDVGSNLTYNSYEKDKVTVAQGGYSNVIVVNEKFVLRIPKNLPLDKSAPLLCAGITLYSPLKTWQCGPGKKVAIIGLGGLGHMGVKLARAMGAEVTVLSQSLKKQADGMKMGAHHFYATSEKETFKKLAGQFDLIINTVSSVMDWNLYLNLLRVDGTFVVVGIPDKAIPVGAFPLILKRRRLAGSLIGGIKETQEMLDFCGKNNITSDIEMVSPDHINEAFERVIKSDVRYRFVVDMNKL